MKVLFIFLLTLIGMILINFGMDLLTGLYISTALTNIFNPFWVITPFGYLLVTVLFLALLITPIIFRKRCKKEERKLKRT